MRHILHMLSLRMRQSSFFTLVFLIATQVVFAQTHREEAENTTNWVEKFGSYQDNWAEYTGNSSLLSAGKARRPSGSSSDCATKSRGRYILFNDLGIPAGAYNVDLRWIDAHKENTSQMWFLVGSRVNVAEPPAIPQSSLDIADNWLADQVDNSGNAVVRTRSYTNIELDASDTIFLFVCADGGERCAFDYIEFTYAGNLKDPVIANQTFSIDEGVVAGTSVGVVTATDIDQPLSYSITGGNIGNVFAINSSTGEITVNGVVDFEVTPSYALTVQVTDNGTPSRSATATVNVNVRNLPEINAQTFSINENSLISTPVGTVVASHPGSLTYSIISGNTGNAFTINSSNGAIRVAGSTNYESISSYTLTVQVVDNSDPSRKSTAIITVNINDVEENPNTPTIADQTFLIDENSAIGVVVDTVIASDADANQSLSFTITAGNTGNVFAIDKNTGIITVRGILDFETTPSYALVVEVSDNGQPVKSSSATITVDINDLADPNLNAPVIEDQVFAVDENSSAGTVVGTVVASDVEWWQSLSFSVYAEEQAGVFNLDPLTGVITVINYNSLDYEVKNSYTLTVVVSDNGFDEVKTDTATILININDLNETGLFPFAQRKVWDGPFDIRMIAAPNLQPVFLNPTHAANGILYADSLITQEILHRTGDLMEINNRYKEGNPFVKRDIPLSAILCKGNPNTENCVLGLKNDGSSGSCPVKYAPETVSMNVSMTYSDYDNDLSTFSSSMAQLDIPSCAEIEAAYLYWTGNFKGSNPDITLMDSDADSMNTYNGDGSLVFNTSTTSGHNSVLFKVPGGEYQKVTATAGNTMNRSRTYVCVADVTNMVRGAQGGQFWAANIQSYPNEGDGGSTSGWTLVVVFQSPLSAPRMISLWDGLEEIQKNNSKQFNLTGLTTPANSNFNSYMGFAALDGENLATQLGSGTKEGLGIQGFPNGTYFEVNPFASDQAPYKIYTDKGYPANCSRNDNKNSCGYPLFNGDWCTLFDGVSSSHITTYDENLNINGNELVRLPSNTNTLGFDAHHMKLPSGAITPGDNEATLTVKAGPQGSTIPFLAYVAVESVQPKLTLSKFANRTTAGLDSLVTYTLRVKNEGNAPSIGGDIIYDTLDVATNFVSMDPVSGVTLESSTGDTLRIKLNNPIPAGVTVDIPFTVRTIKYESNPALFNAPQCKRSISNTAYMDYVTDNGIIQIISNATECGVGYETSVYLVDPMFIATPIKIGPFEICNSLDVIYEVQNQLLALGINPADINRYDILDINYAKVTSGSQFDFTQNTELSYYAVGNLNTGSCQVIYEFVFTSCNPVCINIPPTAANDTITVCLEQGEELILNVLKNDSDADNDNFVVTQVFGANGLSIVGDSAIKFVPDLGLQGSVEFSYEICDDHFGCLACDTASVIVCINTPDELVIPNLITPGKDARNNFFEIAGLFPNSSLKVYNRWGKLVYSSNNYNNDWQPEDKADGIFFYHFNDTIRKQEKKGWLHVVNEAD